MYGRRKLYQNCFASRLGAPGVGPRGYNFTRTATEMEYDGFTEASKSESTGSCRGGRERVAPGALVAEGPRLLPRQRARR